MPWPIDLPLTGDSPLRAEIFGKAYQFELLQPGALRFGQQDKPEDQKLVGGAKLDEQQIRLVPFAGSFPTLVFLDNKLLTPANDELHAVIAIPLHLQIGLGSPESTFKLLDDIAVPGQGKALYGPVDAGIICHAPRGQVFLSLEQARQHAQEAPHIATEADTKENDTADDDTRDDDTKDDDTRDDVTRDDDTTDTEEPITVISPPSTLLTLRVRNETEVPLEVSKLMLPMNFLTLYQDEQGTLLTCQVTMRLLSEAQASLEDGPCPIEGAPRLENLLPAPLRTEPRAHLFSFSYRSKTGLDYGF